MVSPALAMLRTVTATRYVTPLREGGSLPAIVEADDSGLYVLKFHGAGQGPRALVAEVVAGELARAMGLHVPELVLVRLSPDLGRAEPDSEIRALLQASTGLNLGVDYLPGSITFDPVAGRMVIERTVHRDGAVRHVSYFVRLPTPPEWVTWLEAAGFRDVRFRGGGGGPLELDSWEMVVVAIA